MLHPPSEQRESRWSHGKERLDRCTSHCTRTPETVTYATDIAKPTHDPVLQCFLTSPMRHIFTLSLGIRLIPSYTSYYMGSTSFIAQFPSDVQRITRTHTPELNRRPVLTGTRDKSIGVDTKPDTLNALDS